MCNYNIEITTLDVLLQYKVGISTVKPGWGGCKGRRTNNLGTTKQPNVSGTHQLLFSLEELLIAFPTVDGVTVNEDLI